MAFELTAAPILCVTSVPEAIAFYERCFGFARQIAPAGMSVLPPDVLDEAAG